MNRSDWLFSTGDLDATLRAHLGQIPEHVAKISADQLRSSPEDYLVEHVFESLQVLPLELHEDKAEMDHQEVQVDVSKHRERNPFGDSGPIYVPGVRVTVTIPYSGDQNLWRLKPNHWQTVLPRGHVRPTDNSCGHLDLVFEQPADADQERLKKRYEEELKTIRFYVDAQRNQVEQHNEGAKTNIREAIRSRLERLQAHESLSDTFGLPLKRRDGAPPVQNIPIRRKIVRPLPTTSRAEKPEPGIPDADYEHILAVIRHAGRTFEATPSTFSVHGEEELRDIMLAHLNGHYEGGASGETFRRSGKTDIRIEDKNRAAFVAECKVWQGPKSFQAAIDQLLGYLTWRDCKDALVIFNKKNADFQRILTEIPLLLESHAKFNRWAAHDQPGEWKAKFRSAEDDGKEVSITIFAFNVFVPKKSTYREPEQ